MNKEQLKLLNQRPIAYFPLYKDLTTSTTAGVLLSQLMYWFGKKDKFYKTDNDILEETHLTASELKAAKKKIKNLPFISITREGVPAKTYYEIKWDMYEISLSQFAKLERANKTNSSGEIRQTITKITTKIEREENFYKQNEAGIKVYIDEVLKQEKENIRNQTAYKKNLINKFIKEDEATIALYNDWKLEYNIKKLLEACKGKQYSKNIDGVVKRYTLEDIEKNHFEIVAILSRIEDRKKISIRFVFKTYQEIQDYLTTQIATGSKQ
jgi:hypothetical protein